MRSALVAFGRHAKAGRYACTPASTTPCRRESTGRETCFGDMFESTAAESQPHIAPEHGVPGSMDGNTYLQEVHT